MTNFYSMQFLLFIGIALICYYTIFRSKQWMCLLIVNAIFYCWAGPKNFVFLLLTGFTTWLGARWLAKYSEELVAIRKDKNIEKYISLIKEKYPIINEIINVYNDFYNILITLKRRLSALSNLFFIL